MATVKKSKTDKGTVYKHVDTGDGLYKPLKPSDGKKPVKKKK